MNTVDFIRQIKWDVNSTHDFLNDSLKIRPFSDADMDYMVKITIRLGHINYLKSLLLYEFFEPRQIALMIRPILLMDSNYDTYKKLAITCSSDASLKHLTNMLSLLEILRIP